MPKKTGPYVGVTGFMTRAEVDQALAMVPKESPRRLMVGVLMSSKTLVGQTNKWPGRYPKREAVKDIFIDHPKALNLIHYNTDTPGTLVSEVQEIVEWAGPYLDGFQFNIPWPDPSRIEKIRELYPNLFLLLQIGGEAMAQCLSLNRRNPMKVFKEALGWYIPEIDAILIDPSGGKGELGDPKEGIECLRVASEFPGLGLGIAGGFGPKTIHHVPQFAEKLPDLSIDAEGRLRTPMPEDALDMNAVDDYICGSYLALEGIYQVP